MAGLFVKDPAVWGPASFLASFTVEASIVMAVVLWALGFMIKEAYTLYDQVTGSMILQEAVENTRYNPYEKESGREFSKRGEAQGNPRLWLGEYRIGIKEFDSRIEGEARSGGWQSRLEMKRHCPERFLRRIQALLEKRCVPDDGS